MNDLSEWIENIAGFKIPDSHFKIGSKIHISDFYYAKRFFQNGFFASRVAFLLTRDIIEKVERRKLLNSIKSEGITIIGYELYSELLVSFIEKFLSKTWNLTGNLVNHNLYEDGAKLKLCKKNNLNPNVVIIVPIASTFSTAIKVENQVRKDRLDVKILPPLYNVLYISDGEPNDKISSLESQFGWDQKILNLKLIRIKTFYSDRQSRKYQRYYVSLPTVWHDVETCKLCSPNDELPLYETDQTKVTPAVIFDFPKGREIEHEDLLRQYKLDVKSIIYGHYERNNAHYKMAIDTEYFLELNKGRIEEWLFQIKRGLKFKSLYKESETVIIISTCHYSNTLFINIANEILFSGSANIIHYDPSNDYSQNFGLVYGKELNDAGKIFFIDDSLKSGNSFDRIYQFVDSIFIKNKSKKRINGCIFLLNKTQPYTYQNILQKLDENHLFASFANLHLYTGLKTNEASPILLEKNRYEQLTVHSNIDSLKVHFKNKTVKLSNDENNERRGSGNRTPERHRHLLLAIHRIFEYFTMSGTPEMNDFYSFLNHLNTKVKNQIIEYEIDDEITSINESEYAKAYLKSLTQLPFIQHKPLKDKVFTWVVSLLKEHMVRIQGIIEGDEFQYSEFETLKFLIRRTCQINSNILLSKDFLLFLSDLYKPKGIPLLLELPEKSEELYVRVCTSDEKERLKLFFLFYVAQVKELLYKNEYGCLTLEKNLSSFENEKNVFFRQIIRLLRIENTGLISGFYQYLSNLREWKKLFHPAKETDQIIYGNEKIKELLKKDYISKHPKGQALNSFFKITKQNSLQNNDPFINYLWLEYFFAFDKKKGISLNEKTDLVFKKIIGIFKEFEIENVGAFFFVLDNKRSSINDILKKERVPFVAYNQNHLGYSDIDAQNIFTEDNLYLLEFLFGCTKDVPNNKTIVELSRSNDKWYDLYKTSSDQKEIKINSTLIPQEFNRLFLLQISKPYSVQNHNLEKGKSSSDTTKPQALIGFYYTETREGTLSTQLIQYLLILRSSLSQFITNHHENDEFRDWQIANIKQKTSLLTGHGRDMLMRIIARDPIKYSQIIETLLFVQRLVIDKKEEQKFTLGSSNVYKNFVKYFEKKISNTQSEIDNFFLEEEIKVMAIELFKLDLIENIEELQNEDVEVRLNGGGFRFDREIFRMICFEIFVNAKKNRWLFFDNETIVSANLSSFARNKIYIKGEIKENELQLFFSNTGPIERFELDKLNSNSIKRSESSSGIELIRTFLTDFNLGSIQFTSPTNIANDFGIINVLLRLQNDLNHQL